MVDGRKSSTTISSLFSSLTSKSHTKINCLFPSYFEIIDEMVDEMVDSEMVKMISCVWKNMVINNKNIISSNNQPSHLISFTISSLLLTDNRCVINYHHLPFLQSKWDEIVSCEMIWDGKMRVVSWWERERKMKKLIIYHHTIIYHHLLLFLKNCSPSSNKCHTISYY